MTSESKNNEPKSADNLSDEQKKLNEIRNLLFGQNVQEYRSEFEELKAIITVNKAASEQSISDLQSDILDRLEKIENKLASNLEHLNKDLNEKLESLNSQKADKKKIADLLHQLANELDA